MPVNVTCLNEVGNDVAIGKLMPTPVLDIQRPSEMHCPCSDDAVKGGRVLHLKHESAVSRLAKVTANAERARGVTRIESAAVVNQSPEEIA